MLFWSADLVFFLALAIRMIIFRTTSQKTFIDVSNRSLYDFHILPPFLLF